MLKLPSRHLLEHARRSIEALSFPPGLLSWPWSPHGEACWSHSKSFAERTLCLSWTARKNLALLPIASPHAYLCPRCINVMCSPLCWLISPSFPMKYASIITLSKLLWGLVWLKYFTFQVTVTFLYMYMFWTCYPCMPISLIRDTSPLSHAADQLTWHFLF